MIHTLFSCLGKMTKSINLQIILKIKYKFGSRKWDISPTAASKTNFPVKLENSYRDLYQFIGKVPEAI